MKLFTHLFIAVFFILAVVKSSQSQEYYTISGKVRYSDNNELVTSGSIKLVDLNGNTIAVAEIGSQGDYILGPHRILGNFDLIGFPNIEPEMDFVATGYPNKINPEEFTSIFVNSNLVNIDVSVLRTGSLRPNTPVSAISGKVLNNGLPVSDAIVYAKQGEEYFGFGTTNAKGEFKINNLPQGDYILVAHKVGNQSDSRGIELTEGGTDNIVMNVTPKTGAIVSSNNPFEFSLSQNYPNPFNPSTVINYSISNDGFVSLKVYNNLGEEVAVLINTNQSAGTYNIEFNAQSLSSGIYYYRLEASGLVNTRKMILVK